MIIDHEKKYIFVAIAKTACTSVHHRLGGASGGVGGEDPLPDVYHMHLKDILDQYPEGKNYYKFAFVRNPYDRLVSAYYNFRYDSGHSAWAGPIYQFDDFKDFVFGFEATPCKNFIHLKSQFEYLQVGGQINLDFIGRYENLDADFLKIEKALGLENKTLIKTRVGQRPKKLHIDLETKDKIWRIYKDDFEAFRYEK
jgi:hypothetical protein